MAPRCPLPLSEEWEDADSYIEGLLSFMTTSTLFINLCGGVHMLDFLTREPDLYTTLLPEDWRTFFEAHEVQDILRLLLKEDIAALKRYYEAKEDSASTRTWNGGAFPPQTLLEYIHNIKRFALRRDFVPAEPRRKLPFHIAMGMNQKKLHEVEHFSRWVAELSDTVEERRGEPVSHIVDFGSGQNYLGRTLAAPPYNKHIIAIERKHQYISGAKGMDAKLKKTEIHVMNPRKKKKDRLQKSAEALPDTNGVQPEATDRGHGAEDDEAQEFNETVEDVTSFKMLGDISSMQDTSSSAQKQGKKTKEAPVVENPGLISYIEHEIEDGYLEPIIRHVVNPPQSTLPDENQGEKDGQAATCPNELAAPAQSGGKASDDARVMVVSLHSCGNLVHHGVRSLVLNPSVVAVAMIGCCYNLLTERLGPATYKLPVLRSIHPRLYETGTSYDPHGFPMSKLYENYRTEVIQGIRLNITARSMACQAPYNWDVSGTETFFTRNFYRSLFQRILLDKGVIDRPTIPKDLYEESNPEDTPKPVILGSLRKAAFESFPNYIRRGEIAVMTDEEIRRYETEFSQARKNLSITWSLMAFSSQLVEAAIVVDRWQFLREHDSVKECWVEPVFGYGESPGIWP
ncbi:hypothetical protein N7470_006069 [Penicillium chermesinum]|nr:hypothetical protein N7470_006069 [Penicillium chermesinum]